MIVIKWLNEKINVIWLEIDYELMNLYEAIQEKNVIQESESKDKLKVLVEQLNQWEGKK